MKKIFTLLVFTLLWITPWQISAQVEDVATGIGGVQTVLLDGNELYISGGYTNIVKIDINQAFPAPQTEVTAPGYGGTGLALYGTELYFFGNYTLRKIDITNPLPATPETVIGSGLGVAGPILILGDYLYLADWPNNMIRRIDLTSSDPQLEDVISVATPFGIAAKGNEIYAVEFYLGKVVKFDITDSNPSLTDVTSGLSGPTGLTFNGNFLYICEGASNELSRIDINESNPSPETVISSGLSYPQFTAFNGLDIFIANNGSGTVVKYTVDDPVLSTILPVCEGTMPNNLGGASPTGGVYSGPGVTDNGDGQTFSFDPAAAGGVGTYTITYTLGQAATTSLEVVAPPAVSMGALTDVLVDAGVQNLGGGTPAGGMYSGTAVTDGSDGETFSFDPAAAGIGEHEVTYTYTDANGCSATATTTITVNANVGPGNECPDAIDINALFGQPAGEPQVSSLADNTNNNTTGDPSIEAGCFFNEDPFQHTVWFTFTGDGETYNIKSVECTATNYISDGDTQVAIYSGDCSNPVFVSCNEDEDGNNEIYNFNIDLETEMGVEYQMLVDGWDSSTGEFCIQVIAAESIAVTEITQTNIQLFPNPTTGFLQMENVRAETVEIYGTTGQLIKTLVPAENSIDISNLAAGFYMLKIYEGEQIYSAKVIKQ
ncbi:MAG: T9SS type A sorting domain-containing protein [Bacteroidetes bacterium]|nr:T9SS type A sorting domain-containing protein [Bacteroidota bacterium]